MRRSRAREVILEELKGLKTHPRGDELYELVRRRLPRLSLGTVYRNLDLFRREGMALEIACGDFNRYDGDTSPHSHFFCRNCARLWDWEVEVVEKLEGRGGFTLEGRYTVLYGLCPACRAKDTGGGR